MKAVFLLIAFMDSGANRIRTADRTADRTANRAANRTANRTGAVVGETLDERSNFLVEMDSDANIVWRLKRAQLVDQIEGIVDKTTGIEEIRITNVYAYDSEHLRDCLKVRR